MKTHHLWTNRIISCRNKSWGMVRWHAPTSGHVYNMHYHFRINFHEQESRKPLSLIPHYPRKKLKGALLNTLKTETTIYIMTKSWPVSKNITLYLFLDIYLGSYHIIFFLVFHFFVFLLVFLFRFNVEPLYLIYVWLCFAKLFRC